MKQKIREFMTKDPIALPASTPVIEVARKMRDADVGAIIVLDGQEVGRIVTDRDVTIRCVAEGLIPATVRVGDICSKDVSTVSPEGTGEDAVTLMRDKALRRLPVVDSGRPDGIVSLGDLAVEEEAEPVGSTLRDISAAPPNK